MKSQPECDSYRKAIETLKTLITLQLLLLKMLLVFCQMALLVK